MKRVNPIITAPIPQLVRNIAIPVSVGILFNTLFQVVDTFYAGTISKEALAALALSFPIYFIIIGIGYGLSQGTSALIGNYLGADDDEQAAHIIGQGIILTLIVSLFISILGIAASPHLFAILGAEGDNLTFNMSYIVPIFQGTIYFNLVFIFNAVLSSQGHTRPFRNFLIVGFFLNLILDPWFISGGLGLAPMGLAGVGVATSLVQAVGAVYLGYVATGSSVFQSFRWRLFIPNIKRLGQIVYQGLPSALDVSTVSVGGFIVIYFIGLFGTDSIAAYGIASRIDQLIWVPLFGLDVATLTLISQNNGAQNYDRMWDALNTAIRYGISMMLISGIVVFIFAEPLIGIFTDDTGIIAIGVVYIRISAVALLSRPFGFIGFAALRGIKKPLIPMAISIVRMIIAPGIMFYVLINILNAGLESIWWTIALIMIGTGLLAWYIVTRLMPNPKLKRGVIL